MTQPDARYAGHHEYQTRYGEILDYMLEPFSMRLSEEKCYYHPDFFVVYRDRFEIHEVKAFDRRAGRPLVKDDALVKLKVASTVFSWWGFRMVWYDPKIGGWDSRELK